MTKQVGSRTAGLLDMLRVLGIEPLAAARLERGNARYDACSTCISCPSVHACRRLLAGITRLPAPPAFCPNGPYLIECRGRTPAPSA
jgi:hypothetical protein